MHRSGRLVSRLLFSHGEAIEVAQVGKDLVAWRCRDPHLGSRKTGQRSTNERLRKNGGSYYIVTLQLKPFQV